MTVKELSQFYHLTREVDELKCRIKEAEAKKTAISASVRALPTGQKNRKALALAVERAESYRADLAKQEERCSQNLTRLNRFITQCPDSLIRRVLTFRYVYGMSWKKVAEKVGGGNSEDSVKKLVYRYIWQTNTKNSKK